MLTQPTATAASERGSRLLSGCVAVPEETWRPCTTLGVHVSGGYVSRTLCPVARLARAAGLQSPTVCVHQLCDLGKLAHQCTPLHEQKPAGYFQKEHSEVKHGSYIIEGKVAALRPVPCVKSETVGKGVRAGGANVEANNCRSKGRIKFLLIDRCCTGWESLFSLT